ncbi:MAG: hypothetical protein GEV07_09065 [Streptosporangiales bacterium]|nr:hypothetical protein [Streptosporangiales bacterium]
MLHRTNWGALVGGLVLLAIAGIFLLDVVTRPVPLLAVIPLLLVGLGTAAVLNRRFERNRRARPPHAPD